MVLGAVGGLLIAAGLCLGANEGYWFPWVNILGLAVMWCGCVLIRIGKG